MTFAAILLQEEVQEANSVDSDTRPVSPDPRYLIVIPDNNRGGERGLFYSGVIITLQDGDAGKQDMGKMARQARGLYGERSMMSGYPIYCSPVLRNLIIMNELQPVYH